MIADYKPKEDSEKVFVKVSQVVSNICEYLLYLLRLEWALEIDEFEENEEFAAKSLFEFACIFLRSDFVGILNNQRPKMFNSINLNQLQAQLCLFTLEKVFTGSLIIFQWLFAT